MSEQQEEMIRRGQDAMKSSYNLEVSCDHNPTQLFLLMNQQLWDNAQSRLYHAPLEAHTWISSRFPDNNEYKWRNLPLHLACLHVPEPVPLQFVEALIGAYPEAARCRNHEGNMPIHLACECMGFGPKTRLEDEGILIALIRAFPDCLGIKDGKGRTPLEIMDERYMGRGLGIIKYMKAHARGGMAEDQRQERVEDRTTVDECMDRERGKLKRRAKNNAVPKSSSDRTMTLKREKAETTIQSRKSSMRALKDQIPPIIVDQSLHFLRGNKSLELENDPSVVGPAEISRDSQMNVEMQQQRNLVESLLQQQKELLESLRNSSNPIPFVSPISTHPPAMVSPHCSNNTSLHQLDAELSSMRDAHQSMSLLLSTKIQSENELQKRLRELEIEYAQLKNGFVDLTAQHSITVAKLEAKSNEVTALKSKEQNVSNELALKLGLEEKQRKDINVLRNEFEKEKEVQMKRCADLEETIEQSKRENIRLSMENKEYRAQLDKKNKQLQETKTKEATLLGLLSKMHDSPSSFPHENEKLLTENKKLLNFIQETKAKESKMKALLQKSKEALVLSRKQNQQLQMQLDKQKIELQESKANESKLQEELLEVKEQSCEAGELLAKNIALREVALKAIETVGTLHQKIPKSHSSSFHSYSDSLEALLENAEAVSIDRFAHSQVNCMLDAKQSLALLRPIVCDAMSFQQDSIDRIQQLYHYFHHTMELISQISSISHEHFQFQPTLQMLEEILTSHVHIMETLDSLLESKERHKSKLISLLNQEPREERNCIYANIEPLGLGAISPECVHSTKTISLAQHLEKLESLSKTVAKLPRLKRINTDTNMEDVKLHLNKVDEITHVLDKALLILVKDARQLKVAYDNDRKELDHD
ncbi:hypothetical protein ACHAW5_010010 [Stephanodiscus triporus]|uniref:Uncharacterized protein n=1 Tax=Stephanodiscus triporus TaxID=2934178 RepID=A0ABD3ND76_9STRA